jgi:hypothetical protein
MKVWQITPGWLFVGRLATEHVGILPESEGDEHGDQASVPPGEAHMEDKGTGRRTDVHLPSLRKNARRAATVADGWLRGAGAAWRTVLEITLPPACLVRRSAGFEA